MSLLDDYLYCFLGNLDDCISCYYLFRTVSLWNEYAARTWVGFGPIKSRLRALACITGPMQRIKEGAWPQQRRVYTTSQLQLDSMRQTLHDTFTDLIMPYTIKIPIKYSAHQAAQLKDKQ
jgi:hypothetical protein